MSGFEMRRAGLDDLSALVEIQQSSMKQIAASYYLPSQITAFLKHGEAVLTELTTEANCWVMADGPFVVGCAGWCWAGQIRLSSMQKRLVRDEAEVRSVHVRPGWTRQGIARRLLDHMEAEALAAGAVRLTLLSTLGGVPFYRARGFKVGSEKTLHIDGVDVPGVTMTKPLTTSRSLV